MARPDTRPNKRDDLIDAYAAVDWALAQLPLLHEAVESFTASRPYRIVKKRDPNGKGVLFVLNDVKALPPIINAEVGTVLNSVRSSLDLLSASLARRNGKTPTRYMHFPIWENPNDIMDPIRGIDGSEHKKWLAESERQIIKALKPYPGGNDDLLALHQLDIIRKHERLVGVNVLAGRIRIDGEAAAAGLRIPSLWPRFHNESVLALAPLGASERNIHMTLDVTFNESVTWGNWATSFRGNPLVGPTLFRFARMADAIIKRFDYP